ncbi:uncharacterized protein LOC107362850 [Tetranychus urticae]|uniref:uncharacterized protein LOC107362850 n=1 Tax=Tetranychus urticae TaxID=32264 RepID=UPI00077BE632|nr:uncharacterized protein LOC107362850 [Tetranychus urticae]
MSTTQINGVTFCRNFVNRGYCYGLGCKYLHVDRQIESHYKRTGRLPTELANEWCNTQKILAKRDPNVCQDQNQSKCFRVNCKFGTHHVFRTDMDAGNIVEFTFRPSPKMMDYLAHIYQAPKPYWYSDVLCHIRTPFPLLAEHIIKVLKTFRIQRSQVSFYYNEREIMPNDSNVTPYSLDIGNGVIFLCSLNMAKVRGKNFTDKEKELLVSLIEDHPKKELTTNRNNDKDTSIAKKNFWCEIAESLNSASGNATTFNGDQLKICLKTW